MELLIDMIEGNELPIKEEDDFDLDIFKSTHGGIGGFVLIREDEEGLLERGCEKEDILKLEEGEPRGASHRHSSSSSCVGIRLFVKKFVKSNYYNI